MEILIREFCSNDSQAVVDVFRDSMQSLRMSQGGLHPDEEVVRLVSMPDEKLLSGMTYAGVLFVAEVKETSEIVGIGGFRVGKLNALARSAYSRAHYVKKSFQKGKAGVGVGSLLRKATIEKARAMGLRKLYGFTTAESVGFHKKSGAVFIPLFDNLGYSGYSGKVKRLYYEIELKRSIWNILPVEPFIFSLIGVLDWAHGARERSRG